jgi:hypothetical protein
MEWFRLYLLALSVSLTVIVSGAFLYATWTNRPFIDVLGWTLLLGAFILIGLGIVSLLPLSEYSYASPHGWGRAGANPVILREGVKHMVKKKREPRKRGILLGIVGLTLLLIYLFFF